MVGTTVTCIGLAWLQRSFTSGVLVPRLVRNEEVVGEFRRGLDMGPLWDLHACPGIASL